MSIYSGDVRKFLGVKGSTIRMAGGQPEMTTGLMNAVIYSLFASSWVGNAFVPGDSRLESGFEASHNEAITIDRLLEISAQAEKSLAWCVKEGVAPSVTTATTMKPDNRVETLITLGSSVFMVTKFAQHWGIEEKT